MVYKKSIYNIYFFKFLDKKVEHLTNYTAEIKLKVDKILLNQERMLNFLRRQQIGEPNNAQSEEFDIHFETYYPLKKPEDFLHITELLKNENYYKLLVRYLHVITIYK